MKAWKEFFVLGLLFPAILLLAGCTGGSAQSAAQKGPEFVPRHDEFSGSITGTVVDDSYLPIVDAKVSLLTPNGTAAYMVSRTDASGRYALNFIPAGTYKVEAKGPGYVSLERTVEVKEGETVTAATFVLSQGVNFEDVGFYVTDHLSKMIGGGTAKYGFECGQTPMYKNGVSVPNGEKYCVGGNTCAGEAFGCKDVAGGCLGSYSKSNGKEPTGYGTSTDFRGGYRDLLMNNTDWQNQIAELTWTQSSAVSGRGVLFEILGPNVTNGSGGHTSRCGSINQSDPRDFLVLADKSPTRLEVNRDLLAVRKINQTDECCDWRFRLFPGWCDLGSCSRWGPDANALGAIFPTRVEVWYTIFFKEPAPPGWTILKDG